ncbi:tetratricopeptide repeat protein [Candidatus Riflebacteria bacterium]
MAKGICEEISQKKLLMEGKVNEQKGKLFQAVKIYEKIFLDYEKKSVAGKGGNQLNLQEYRELCFRLARNKERVQPLPREAMTYYLAFLKVSKNPRDRYRNTVIMRLLSLFVRGGNNIEGIDFLKGLLKIEPRNYNYLRYLAIFYEKEGKIEAAKDVYQRMWELYSSEPDFKKLLSLSQQLNQEDYVYNLLQEGLAKQPYNTNLLKLMSNWHFSNGGFKKAIPGYEKVLKRRPFDHPCRLNLAECYLRLKDIKKGREQLEDILARKPDYFPALRRLGFLYYDLGKKNEAKEVWKNIIKLKFYDEKGYEEVAKFYIEAGDFKGALAILELGQKKLGNPQLFATQMAMIYQASLNPEEAIAKIIEILFRKPYDMDIRQRVYEYYEEKSELTKLFKIIEERRAEMKKVVQEGTKNQLKSQQLDSILLDFYFRGRQIDRVRDIVKTITGSSAENVFQQNEILNSFAKESLKNGFPKLALFIYQEIFASLGNSTDGLNALYNWAQLSFKQGNYEAIKGKLAAVFKGALDTVDFDIEIKLKILYARVLRKSNSPPKDVFAFYSDIMKKFPGSKFMTDIREDIIEFLIETGEYDVALKEINRALKNRAGIKDRIYFLMAEVFRMKFDFARAMREYEKIVNEYPASLLVNDALEKMMFLTQNSGRYLIPLKLYIEAENMWKRGKFGEAQKILQQIIANYENSTLYDNARFKMVEIFLKQGKKNVALKLARAFLEELIESEKYAEMQFLEITILEDIFGNDARVISTAQEFVLSNPKNLRVVQVKKKIKRLKEYLLKEETKALQEKKGGRNGAKSN